MNKIKLLFEVSLIIKHKYDKYYIYIHVLIYLYTQKLKSFILFINP